ncbi:glycosyltransferase [Sediminispirochaeta smaragdinae]|uniref:Glycosyl transferase group 1 n=1 Tax=Sediminispirochaeta smaragdinae (strain DSM 11293 / JCM 15392 / SEBR 4228) TaxID=573413 RepID=E1RBU4_SEDSS|nr:glycosyltransferase [Sediminispirochaeta smaragdinae]ADK79824.1 glycosyl transferase group 1 [Sediminispirochaeta smaragdinae DSM 11293]
MKRILIIGWADIRKASREGGGYNLVALHHAHALAAEGCSVYYLQSGRHYGLSWLWGRKPSPFILPLRRWHAIRRYALFNSSQRAPEKYNFHSEKSLEDLDQSRIVARWVKRKAIDEVYIHSLEGSSLSLPRLLKQIPKVKLVIFCHDHYYLCPQIQLLYRGKSACTDYLDGSRCYSCRDHTPAGLFEKRRARRMLGWEHLYPLAVSLLALLGIKWKKRESLSPCDPPIPFPPETAVPTNELFLSLLSAPRGENFYACRRTAAITALQHADLVLSPSSFIAETLKHAGLSSDRLKVVKLGLPHLDALKVAAQRLQENDSCNMPTKGERPLVFSYRGSGMEHKGLPFLVEALAQLPNDISARIHVIIRGIDPVLYAGTKWLRLAETLPYIEIHPPYTVQELYGFVHEYDIGFHPHLWFENSPVALLEHIAAGKPVVAADLGGVKDYITEGENGWLYPAGNQEALISLISRIVRGEILIPRVSPHTISSFEDFLHSIGGL